MDSYESNGCGNSWVVIMSGFLLISYAYSDMTFCCSVVGHGLGESHLDILQYLATSTTQQERNHSLRTGAQLFAEYGKNTVHKNSKYKIQRTCGDWVNCIVLKWSSEVRWHPPFHLWRLLQQFFWQVTFDSSSTHANKMQTRTNVSNTSDIQSLEISLQNMEKNLGFCAASMPSTLQHRCNSHQDIICWDTSAEGLQIVLN